MQLILRLSVVLLLWTISARARRLVTGDAESVQPGEYANVVSWGFKNPKTDTFGHHCTGTLISPGVVLSAAHCFLIFAKAPKHINLKEYVKVKFPNGNTVGISDFVLHPDSVFVGDVEKKHKASLEKGEYGQAYQGDLALLYLNKCVTDVRPVHLRFRKPGDAELTCEHGTVVGYGNIHFNGFWRGPIRAFETVSVARKATVRIHSAEACEQLLPFYSLERVREGKTIQQLLDALVRTGDVQPFISEFDALKRTGIGETDLRERLVRFHQLKGRPVVCSVPTTQKLQETSNGDSGGPMFVDGVQVGVLSGKGGFMGLGAGHLKYHTRVDRYIEWIERHGISKDKCESSKPPVRRLRSKDGIEELQTKVFALSDTKVAKAIRYLVDYDQCPVSGTYF